MAQKTKKARPARVNKEFLYKACKVWLMQYGTCSLIELWHKATAATYDGILIRRYLSRNFYDYKRLGDRF